MTFLLKALILFVFGAGTIYLIIRLAINEQNKMKKK